MKTKLNIKEVLTGFLPWMLLLFSVLSAPAGIQGADLKFERMWPVLKQPWYFKFPNDIALDEKGNFYVTDFEDDTIQKFTSDGQFILKWGVAGSEDSKLMGPLSIAVDNSGNIYVTDKGNFRIQKFTPDGQYITGWEANTSGTDEYAGFSGMDIDSSNMMYVTDNKHHMVKKFTLNGSLVTQWGSQGSGDGQLNSSSAIAAGNDNHVYVVDAGNHRIQKFTSDGTFVLQWGQKGDGNEEFDFGSDGSVTRGNICVDKAGFVYVSDNYNACIKKFTSQEKFVKKYGIADWQYTGTEKIAFDHPSGLDADSSGYLYVADVGNPGITKFSNDQFVANWGGAGKDKGEFDKPSGVAIDRN